jgi:hypothetical protein
MGKTLGECRQECDRVRGCTGFAFRCANATAAVLTCAGSCRTYDAASGITTKLFGLRIEVFGELCAPVPSPTPSAGPVVVDGMALDAFSFFPVPGAFMSRPAFTFVAMVKFASATRIDQRLLDVAASASASMSVRAPTADTSAVRLVVTSTGKTGEAAGSVAAPGAVAPSANSWFFVAAPWAWTRTAR